MENAVQTALRAAAAGPNRSRDLTVEEARDAALEILSGGDPAAAGGLLMALRVKPEAAEEIAGFALGLRQHRVNLGAPAAPYLDCAAAYDGRIRTLPVDAAAALIAARAGIRSLFHGVSGLGRAGTTPGKMLGLLAPDAKDVQYVDQIAYCPPLAALLPLRNRLPLRTVWNSAEKLASPCGESLPPAGLLIGVFHGGFLEILARAAMLCGFRRVLVVQGPEGSDELPITRDSRVCEVLDGELRQWHVRLSEIGVEVAPAAAMECSSAGEAAARLIRSMEGAAGPEHEALVLNTAVRLYLGQCADSLKSAVVMARELMPHAI